MPSTIAVRKRAEESGGGTVLEWRRRADVLTRPALPCLAPYHALNLTAGCPNDCRYCYAQSYPHHPGKGKVAFYVNMKERLFDEFPRMRQRPRLVYFSTASEPFLAVDKILDDLYAIMAFLLGEGVRLLISTKGVIPDRFVELFAKHKGMAHVQVGLTTVDDSVRQMMEPHAATVSERLDNLERLIGANVSAEARMDPLVPGLTDEDLSFDALLFELSKRGATTAAASYMFSRWGIRIPWNLKWKNWSYRAMRDLYTCKVTDYCGKGRIWIPSAEYRRRKYADLKVLGDAHGISVRLCRCKNKDIADECCHPLPKPEPVFGIPMEEEKIEF